VTCCRHLYWGMMTAGLSDSLVADNSDVTMPQHSNADSTSHHDTASWMDKWVGGWMGGLSKGRRIVPVTSLSVVRCVSVSLPSPCGTRLAFLRSHKTADSVRSGRRRERWRLSHHPERDRETQRERMTHDRERVIFQPPAYLPTYLVTGCRLTDGAVLSIRGRCCT